MFRTLLGPPSSGGPGGLSNLDPPPPPLATPLPCYVVTDEYRQICGIGGMRINVPLVQAEIRSERVSGVFELGVCNNLPGGIDMLALTFI